MRALLRLSGCVVVGGDGDRVDATVGLMFFWNDFYDYGDDITL